MIREEVKRIIAGLPNGVTLVGAAKTRSPHEIMEAIDAGLTIVGENYVQEAEQAFNILGHRVKWHMIGHLQKNKVKKAVNIFDMIETIDSMKLCALVDRASGETGKIMPVLIEINSGEEDQKAGVMPEQAIPLIKGIAALKNIRVMGLMTMGPLTIDPEALRPCFRKTREIFDHIKNENLEGVEMKYLSMGMSDSYKIAIEEGANLVRIGTGLFGKRDYR
jgi:pyridoxal phosphate enzyme (YggS family)